MRNGKGAPTAILPIDTDPGTFAAATERSECDEPTERSECDEPTERPASDATLVGSTSDRSRTAAASSTDSNRNGYPTGRLAPRTGK